MRRGGPSPRARRRVGTAAGLISVLIAAGCGSGNRSASSGTTAPPATSASAPTTTTTGATATTRADQLPTVPNCGGGAYEPATLLIVCGVGTTTATGVTWQSWGTTGATGTGTVHLRVGGSTRAAPGHLALGRVVSGGVGPQFSVLTVTWSGPSPDGHRTDTFRLSLGG